MGHLKLTNELPILVHRILILVFTKWFVIQDFTSDSGYSNNQGRAKQENMKTQINPIE